MVGSGEEGLGVRAEGVGVRGWGEGGEGVVRMGVMKRVVRRCGKKGR